MPILLHTSPLVHASRNDDPFPVRSTMKILGRIWGSYSSQGCPVPIDTWLRLARVWLAFCTHASVERLLTTRLCLLLLVVRDRGQHSKATSSSHCTQVLSLRCFSGTRPWAWPSVWRKHGVRRICSRATSHHRQSSSSSATASRRVELSPTRSQFLTSRYVGSANRCHRGVYCLC